MLKQYVMNSFKKDLKLAQKRKKDTDKIKKVMSDLVNEIPLEPKHEDHPLKGEYDGCRECHVEPDWLLIYMYANDEIRFVRNGTHSDLFKN